MRGDVCEGRGTAARAESSGSFLGKELRAGVRIGLCCAKALPQAAVYGRVN